MSREWILGCFKPGGTTECTGPALFNGQRVVVHEVTPDSIVITKDQLAATWDAIAEEHSWLAPSAQAATYRAMEQRLFGHLTQKDTGR